MVPPNMDPHTKLPLLLGSSDEKAFILRSPKELKEWLKFETLLKFAIIHNFLSYIIKFFYVAIVMKFLQRGSNNK